VLFERDLSVKSTYWIALILVIVGAVNWGLVGLFQFDLVAALFGPMSALSRLVYALVGLAGIALAGTAAAAASNPNRGGMPVPTR
jgi:uncharacterized protein